MNQSGQTLKEKSKILEINSKLIISLQTPQLSSIGDKTDRFGREILDKTNDTIKNLTPKSTGMLKIKSFKANLNNYCSTKKVKLNLKVGALYQLIENVSF